MKLYILSVSLLFAFGYVYLLHCYSQRDTTTIYAGVLSPSDNYHSNDKSIDISNLKANILRKFMLDTIEALNVSINFIQVGSCDGNYKRSNDPLQQYMFSSPQFHGVMIEPVPHLFEKLRKNLQHRSDAILPLNVAVSADRDGNMPFYMIDHEKVSADWPTAPHHILYQLGSFEIEHLQEHLQRVMLPALGNQSRHDWRDYVAEIAVQTLTPTSIVDRYRTSGLAVGDANIHILLIDAEGFDAEILAAFMKMESMRPNLIVYEKKWLISPHPSPNETRQFLNSLGYYVQDWADNELAVRLEKTFVFA